MMSLTNTRPPLIATACVTLASESVDTRSSFHSWRKAGGLCASAPLATRAPSMRHLSYRRILLDPRAFEMDDARAVLHRHVHDACAKAGNRSERRQLHAIE